MDSMTSPAKAYRISGRRGALLRLPVGGLAAAFAVAAVLSACSDKAAGKQETPGSRLAQAAVPVTVSEVMQKDVPVQLRAIGHMEAYTTVSVKSQVSGQLLRVHFAEGQSVKKGDLLFTIDPRPFEAALRQAEGNLARDVAQLQQAEATLAQKMAEEETSKANLARDAAQLENARAQARRYQELIEQGAIAQEQYDQVRTAADAMEATVQADRAAVDNAKAAIRVAQAAVESAKAAIQADQAAVESARLQLGYTSIRSSIGGRTGNLLVHAGNLVKANDDMTPLVVIHQIHPISLTFSVPEQDLADIKKYMKTGILTVETIIPDQSGLPAHGALTFVNNAVDPATGTIQLKATFPNTDDTLWPGQFVDVVLTLTSEPHAVVIPSQALQTGQKGPYVFVVKQDLTVESRPVTIARTVGQDAVIAQGLKPGERVVTDGQVRLFPGARIDIRPSAPPPNAE
ncbi:MAG: efflux RND transporter periplasmic adaptor subunit [candidate division NC10 bacterium]|nr:efflux RND transporter periplasmic adaptor subunit [candidate division NC10 bacterium]